MKRGIGFLVVALIATALVGSARADLLDKQINDQMPDLLEKLKKDHRNVGVLRFRVQDGTRPITFDTPLSGRMAERVETLLILNGGPVEREALGVIHDPGSIAHKNGIEAWFNSTAERRRLFTLKYPLAWGNKQVQADAFLTGKVTLSLDRKKTTVALELIERAAPHKLTRLGTYVVDTNRSLLRDLGYSFAMSRAARSQLHNIALKRDTTAGDEDDLIIDEVDRQQTGQSQPQPGKPPRQNGGQKVSPANIAGIKVEMLVDEKVVNFREAGASGQTAIPWQIDCPPVGSKVAFRLSNTTDRRLGVVLRLNGVSTINEQKDEPEMSAKWILPGGTTYLLRGYYLFKNPVQTAQRGPDDQPAGGQPTGQTPKGLNATRLPFKILVGEEAQREKGEMADKGGLIEVDVFEAGERRAEEFLVSPKGLPPSQEKQARSSYVDLRSALLKSSKLKTQVEEIKRESLITKREIIVPDRDEIQGGGPIKLVDFPNPRLAGRLSIKILATETPQRD